MACRRSSRSCNRQPAPTRTIEAFAATASTAAKADMSRAMSLSAPMLLHEWPAPSAFTVDPPWRARMAKSSASDVGRSTRAYQRWLPPKLTRCSGSASVDTVVDAVIVKPFAVAAA